MADLTTEGEALAPKEDSSAWWRFWAIAALAHLFGRPVSDWGLDVVVSLVLGFAAFAVLVHPFDHPRHRRLRSGLAVAVVVSVLVEMPLVGNHWLLAGFVSLIALTSRPWADDWLTRAAPPLRVSLLVFYSFAAFAKLNSGFFDTAASCARFFANQSLGFWQLPHIGADSWAARAVILGSVGIELSVPLLLMWRPTRRFGVVLAIGFHSVLALDLGQHFFDFTLVLVPLFLLFTPPGTLAELDRSIGGPRSPARPRWTVPLAALILGFSLPFPPAYQGLAILGSWLLWFLLLVVLARALIRTRWQSSALVWRVPRMTLVVLALVILNGLSPYLGLKTATGFNMYANLLTADGETNHYLLPATARLGSEQADLAVILATTDADLGSYIDSGFALPMTNLQNYLAAHPDVSVTFERAGKTVTARPARSQPGLIEAQPWLTRRFLYLRAVPLDDPPACQNSWLPAH